MRQLTWNEAESIAAAAAKRAEGFGADLAAIRKLTAEQHVIEARKLAHNAAAIALKMAGCLVDSDAADARAIDRAAALATQKHRAWCKATGAKF